MPFLSALASLRRATSNFSVRPSVCMHETTRGTLKFVTGVYYRKILYIRILVKSQSEIMDTSHEELVGAPLCISSVSH